MDRVAINNLPEDRATETVACFHCGLPCEERLVQKDGKPFCCDGCRLVYDILIEGGLGQFYDLNEHAGVRPKGTVASDPWVYLDQPQVEARLLDFTDGTSSRVTLQIPSIHCVACVWLLENLFRLHPAISGSRVHYSRREVSIHYATEKLKLSELVALLASIGYEPLLTLDDLDRSKARTPFDRQKLQIGIAGFAFANIMLFSIPVYLGLDTQSRPLLQTLFGYLSLVLAVPVLFYSAGDYWRSARWSIQQRMLTLDVPIALGLAALFSQSTYEIVSGRGEGYLDSLVGLVFFLLCGRWFQQRTHDRLAFDRDYRSFFPLAVLRRTIDGDVPAALAQLQVGDRLLLRHGELIPADGRLIQGEAQIDYSFVTGESRAVTKIEGDQLYAGGRQVGGTIEIEVVKPVSQSYLTSLWDHSAFRKQRDDPLNTLTQHYGRRFTRMIITIAVGSGLYWTVTTGLGQGVTVLVAVLIVACPCALALAAPFSFGTAQRWLARRNIFVKSSLVLERLARVNTIVFDKTGTLTGSSIDAAVFEGTPLTAEERASVSSLARASTHPLARRIFAALHQPVPPGIATLRRFQETPGCGIEGVVDGQAVRLGSLSWLARLGTTLPMSTPHSGSIVGLVLNGVFRGLFRLGNSLRPAVGQLLRSLGGRYELVLLSGDQPRDIDSFRELFGAEAALHFNQSPLDKLEHVLHLQTAGKTVLMVGDGLNDAGAFQQSDVGMAVVEQIGSFSPASDVIMDADQVAALGEVLRFARRTVRVVRLSLALSACYNVLGLSVAAAGLLSPLICAILMPLSSVTVVLFATAATTLAFQRFGLTSAVQSPLCSSLMRSAPQSVS